MGLFSWLFGNGKSNAQSGQSNLLDGFWIVSYDYGEVQARTLFQRANAGDVNAQMTIAKCFKDSCEHGYALPWYEKAAARGNSQALHELTYFYEGRYVGVAADPVKAEMLRNKALELNNPDAFLKLGSQYDSGDGVKEDKGKAFEYYMKAAKLGNGEAMARVGLCYLNGEGVKQNESQAFNWFLRSNDKYFGYYNLAQCYLKGIGTTKNMEKAVVWLEKAVDCKCMDLSKAREQLADLYRKGYGGSDASKKLNKLNQEIGKSDRLLDELANLLM